MLKGFIFLFSRIYSIFSWTTVAGSAGIEKNVRKFQKQCVIQNLLGDSSPLNEVANMDKLETLICDISFESPL